MTIDISKITVRDEVPEDREAVRAVTIDAFAGSDLGHNGEADLVDVLRESSQSYLSLVACCEDHLVGHILFTPVAIRSPQTELHGMGLAPMSVATDWQRKGIGALLLKTGIDRLSKNNCAFVVVLGHADYYSRYGFVHASGQGVLHGFSGIPQDVFFIRGVDENARMAVMTDALAYYQPEFGPQHVDR